MRVFTYNCCGIPFFSKDIPHRIHLIANEIARLDPDLVLLQEVFLEGHVRILKKRLRKWPHMFSAARAWRTLGGGLAVFSKAPLRDVRFVRFRSQGPIFRYSAFARVSRKGYVSALVEPPGRPSFRVVTTHLIADYRCWRQGPAGPDARGAKTLLESLWKRGALARGDPYPGLQKSQIVAVGNYIGTLDRGTPLLVCGDFNMTPRSPLLRDFLRKTGLTDSMEGVLKPSVIKERYYRLPFHDAPNRRLDYVLHRAGGGTGFSVRGARYVCDGKFRMKGKRRGALSDHLAVLVDLDCREHCETV